MLVIKPTFKKKKQER